MYYRFEIGTEGSPTYTFTSQQGSTSTFKLQDAEVDQQTDVVSNELYIDNGVFKVYSETALTLTYGTPVRLYEIRNNVSSIAQRMYIKDYVQPSQYLYEINAVSVIGLFDNEYYTGGIRTGTQVVAEIASIFGGSIGTLSNDFYPITGGVETCYVSSAVATEKLYGLIPYTTKRGALHQVLFAMGISPVRNTNGYIEFKFNNVTSYSFLGDQNTYIGTFSKEPNSYNSVEVVEHTYQYAENTDYVELFNNSDVYSVGVTSMRVIFSEPINPNSWLVEGNLTLNYISQTYALVTGKGVLKAKPYVHLTRRVGLYSGTRTKVATFEDFTLVSPLNVDNVAQRMWSYFAASAQYDYYADTKYEDTGYPPRRVGLGYYSNDYSKGSGSVYGTLERCHTHYFNNVTRQNGRFHYFSNNTTWGNRYKNSVVLTGSGNWTVPASIKSGAYPYIQMILIGGGNGGAGGDGGEQGKGTYTDGSYNGHGGGAGGRGGKGGIGGLGGKVYSLRQLSIATTNRIYYSCGSGGSGGAKGWGGYNGYGPWSAGAGVSGSYTNVQLINDNGVVTASYNSLQGDSLPSGILDLPNNIVYALPGFDGDKGGDGGEGGVAAAGARGTAGESITSRNGMTFTGGTGSEAGYAEQAGTALLAACGGGGGGGAAYGNNGTNAPTNGRAAYQAYVYGGDGGNGATASQTIIYPSRYGQGGDGGAGGGGGGTGGAQNWYPFHSGVHDGYCGTGGDGQGGAPGAAGCVVIYY